MHFKIGPIIHSNHAGLSAGLIQDAANMRARLETDGYVILPPVLDEPTLDRISMHVAGLSSSGAGSRNILDHEWCRDLARQLASCANVRDLLPEGSVAVQCTYFTKSASTNWLVAPHRDQFIPVKFRVANIEWSGWSIKEGTHFVRPPVSVLKSLVALRLHLEENTIQNGPLKVVPGSHMQNGDNDAPIMCTVEKGGVVAIKPLILHSSSRVVTGTRRVLHFLYGLPKLPDEAEWQYAVY